MECQVGTDFHFALNELSSYKAWYTILSFAEAKHDSDASLESIIALIIKM